MVAQPLFKVCCLLEAAARLRKALTRLTPVQVSAIQRRCSARGPQKRPAMGYFNCCKTRNAAIWRAILTMRSFMIVICRVKAIKMSDCTGCESAPVSAKRLPTSEMVVYAYEHRQGHPGAAKHQLCERRWADAGSTVHAAGR